MTKKLLLSHETCDHIDDIIMPLKEHGLKGFYYIRIYSDFSFFEFSNLQETMKYFLEIDKGESLCQALKDYYNLSCNQYLSTTACASPILRKLREKFQVGDTFLLINNQYNYKEIFSFVVDLNKPHFVNFCFENLNYLWDFTYFFYEKAERLLYLADKQPLQWRGKFINSKLYENELCANLPDLNYKYCHIPTREGVLKLTKHQAKIIALYIHGSSSKKISEVTGVSHRTIERIIFNIKQKSKTHFKSELHDLLSKSAICKVFDMAQMQKVELGLRVYEPSCNLLQYNVSSFTHIHYNN